jgi:predicted RNA-binding Zn-ribbon protein involved in translation (DUF1610 family)
MSPATSRREDPAPSGEGSSREPGTERSPILVPLLTYVTLRFYLYYWVWTASEAVERFDPYTRSPHAPARWGVPLALGGSIVVAGSLAAVVLADLLVPIEAVLAGRVSAWLAVLGAAIALGGLAYLVGSVLLWVALWRIWQHVQTHERNLGYEPISPSLMLVLWAGSLLVVGALPLLGWAAQLAARAYVLYRTQRGLNRVWTGAAGGYQARPPVSPMGPMAPVQPGPDRRPAKRRPTEPPPMRAGDTPIPPTSVTRSRARGEREPVPFTCEACGNRELIPNRRPLRVNCPSCGESELLRGTEA